MFIYDYLDSKGMQLSDLVFSIIDVEKEVIKKWGYEKIMLTFEQ